MQMSNAPRERKISPGPSYRQNAGNCLLQLLNEWLRQGMAELATRNTVRVCNRVTKLLVVLCGPRELDEKRAGMKGGGFGSIECTDSQGFVK